VGSRYEEVCRSIKLDRFANLDLQAEINKYVASLPNLAINAGQIPYSTLLQKEGGTGTWVELEDSGSLWTVRLLPREPQGGDLSSGTELPLKEPPRTQDGCHGRVCASPSNPFLGETDAGTMRDQHSGRGLSPPSSQGQMFVDTHFWTPPDTSHGTGQPSVLGFQAINRSLRQPITPSQLEQPMNSSPYNELTVATDRPTTPSCTQTEMLGNSGASTTPRDWCVGGCSITSGDSGFPGGGRLPDADGERRSGLDVLVGGGRADKYYNGFSSTARECNSDFDIDWYIDLSHSSNEDNN
jgi:hypothetical protein